MIAAEKEGLQARLVELEPRFVDVAVRRWEEFTGKRAHQAVTGRTLTPGRGATIPAPRKKARKGAQEAIA